MVEIFLNPGIKIWRGVKGTASSDCFSASYLLGYTSDCLGTAEGGVVGLGHGAMVEEYLRLYLVAAWLPRTNLLTSGCHEFEHKPYSLRISST